VADDPGRTGGTACGTGLLTDHYELTMVQAALRSGTADRRSVFELFGRRLPGGRRYGVRWRLWVRQQRNTAHASAWKALNALGGIWIPAPISRISGAESTTGYFVPE